MNSPEVAMKRILMLLILAVLVVASIPAQAARKDCAELKQEIAARIDAKGVKHYTLDIAAADATIEGKKIVGSCNGGTQRIVYQRIDAVPASVAKVD
jgi:Protein of unknown function (DUF1161)